MYSRTIIDVIDTISFIRGNLFSIVNKYGFVTNADDISNDDANVTVCVGFIVDYVQCEIP